MGFVGSKFHTLSSSAKALKMG